VQREHCCCWRQHAFQGLGFRRLSFRPVPGSARDRSPCNCTLRRSQKPPSALPAPKGPLPALAPPSLHLTAA
jgi:hypothetical protein